MKTILLCLVTAACFCAGSPVRAQGYVYSSKPSAMFVPSSRNAENVLTDAKINRYVEFLADTTCAGRATGTAGNIKAGFWIESMFRKMGLQPINDGCMCHSFDVGKDYKGHNIIGLQKGSGQNSDRYIIVGAHYDNLGVIGGKTYPGADSNASGVAAMIGISEMFRSMMMLGKSYRKSIIYVAFDAKTPVYAGSESMYKDLAAGKFTDPVSGKVIKVSDVDLMVNLDILGSSESPLSSGRPDYLLMLSGGKYTGQLTSCNGSNKALGLDLCFSYYGSREFTNLFYLRSGDHKIFMKHGIDAVLFTSGITMRTNKEDDVLQHINITSLRKRTWLIFHWLERLV